MVPKPPNLGQSQTLKYPSRSPINPNLLWISPDFFSASELQILALTSFYILYSILNNLYLIFLYSILLYSILFSFYFYIFIFLYLKYFLYFVLFSILLILDIIYFIFSSSVRLLKSYKVLILGLAASPARERNQTPSEFKFILILKQLIN